MKTPKEHVTWLAKKKEGLLKDQFVISALAVFENALTSKNYDLNTNMWSTSRVGFDFGYPSTQTLQDLKFAFSQRLSSMEDECGKYKLIEFGWDTGICY